MSEHKWLTMENVISFESNVEEICREGCTEVLETRAVMSILMRLITDLKKIRQLCVHLSADVDADARINGRPNIQWYSLVNVKNMLEETGMVDGEDDVYQVVTLESMLEDNGLLYSEEQECLKEAILNLLKLKMEIMLML